jgi:hypothetical protein
MDSDRFTFALSAVIQLSERLSKCRDLDPLFPPCHFVVWVQGQGYKSLADIVMDICLADLEVKRLLVYDADPVPPPSKTLEILKSKKFRWIISRRRGEAPNVTIRLGEQKY